MKITEKNLIPFRKIYMYVALMFHFSLKSSIELIDIPGHDRLRQNLIDQYKSDVRGVIFMVDSKSIQIEVRDVAE